MKGVTQILSDSSMEKIRDAAIGLLTTAGMKVCHRQILEALAKAGAKVDYARERAVLTPGLIARYLPEASTNMADWELSCPDANKLGIWGSHPFVMDWPSYTLRPSTRKDLTAALQAAHCIQEIDYIAPPLSIQEVPSPIEPVESMALTMLTTDKKLGGAEIILPEQIKYAVAFGEIATGQANSGVFVPQNEYFTSPLIFGERSAACFLENLRFGIASSVGTMATSGLNAPGTVAGTVTLGLAELIGGFVMFKAVDPARQYPFIACTGILDMTTANACFSAPECTLQNMALYQIMRRLYGREIVVAQQYVDAPAPGIQATFEKTHRFCTTAAFGAHILQNNGILKAGLSFSPEQCLLDLETNRALLRIYLGIEVDDDTLARDVLASVCQDDSPNFLNEEHTVRHCRQNFWIPSLPVRCQGQTPQDWRTVDEKILKKAQERWNAAKDSYRPIDVPEDKRRAIAEVVKRAHKDLLS